MPQHGPILIISGTNRPGANAMKVARTVESHYRAAGIDTQFYSLSEMPAELFNPESYAKKPEPWKAVQTRIVESKGLHIVTPEYNGSFPGVLKYFIDMLKFPESFERKCVAFVGEANGLWGALRPVEQLQQIFSYRNAYIYPDRVFIPAIGTRYGPDGTLSDQSIDDRLRSQATGFARFVEKMIKPETA